MCHEHHNILAFVCKQVLCGAIDIRIVIRTKVICPDHYPDISLLAIEQLPAIIEDDEVSTIEDDDDDETSTRIASMGSEGSLWSMRFAYKRRKSELCCVKNASLWGCPYVKLHVLQECRPRRWLACSVVKVCLIGQPLLLLYWIGTPLEHLNEGHNEATDAAVELTTPELVARILLADKKLRPGDAELVMATFHAVYDGLLKRNDEDSISGSSVKAS